MPVAGKTHRYVERNRGTTDLNGLTEPPTIIPFAQEDSGARYTLNRDSTYNYLRNAGFWSTQHQRLGVTGLPQIFIPAGTRIMAFDGWALNMGSTTGNNAVTRVSAVTNGQYYRNPYYSAVVRQWDGVDFAGRWMWSQVIEASDVATLRGKVVRLQAKVTCPSFWIANARFNNSVIRLGLLKLSGGTDDTIPTTFTTNSTAGVIPTFGTGLSLIPPLTYGIDGAGADQYSLFSNDPGATKLPFFADFESTIATYPFGRRLGGLWQIPSDAQNLIFVVWTHNVTTGGFGGMGLVLSQPQLTVGESVKEWTCLSPALERVRSQRFVCSSFNDNPRQNAGLAGALRGHANAAGAAADQVLPVRFPVQMHRAPTITLYNPLAANAFVRNTVNITDASASSFANASEQGADITFTGLSTWDVGASVAVHYKASAEL